MTVRIVYVYPACLSPHYTDLAIRFIETYNANPPGVVHDTIVVLNASRKTSEIECLFSPLQNVTFLERNNDGYDVGAFQSAAATFPSDMMVFLGSSTYLRHPNWLAIMAQAFVRNGDTLYGVMGNRGNKNVGVHPHIRTTGWWTSTNLMNRYPHKVTRPEQRYPYEHGPNCFTSWIKARGLKPLVVAANGKAYGENDWDSIPGGFHRDKQEALLCGDRLSALYPWP